MVKTVIKDKPKTKGRTKHRAWEVIEVDNRLRPLEVVLHEFDSADMAKECWESSLQHARQKKIDQGAAIVTQAIEEFAEAVEGAQDAIEAFGNSCDEASRAIVHHYLEGKHEQE